MYWRRGRRRGLTRHIACLYVLHFKSKCLTASCRYKWNTRLGVKKKGGVGEWGKKSCPRVPAFGAELILQGAVRQDGKHVERGEAGHTPARCPLDWKQWRATPTLSRTSQEPRIGWCFQAQVKHMKVEKSLHMRQEGCGCALLSCNPVRPFRQAFRTSIWNSEEST